MLSDSPGRQLAVIVTDHLYRDILGSAPGRAFIRADVTIKELAAPAWAYLPSAPLAAAEGPRRRARLTAREWEVAALVARGLTNREIAGELTISLATVSRHIANIMRNLDLHTRVQIAWWVSTPSASSGQAISGEYEEVPLRDTPHPGRQ
jgi:DNA-binding NarL/FixJ family response regulator